MEIDGLIVILIALAFFIGHFAGSRCGCISNSIIRASRAKKRAGRGR